MNVVSDIWASIVHMFRTLFYCNHSWYETQTPPYERICTKCGEID